MLQLIFLVVIIAFEIYLGALVLIKNPHNNANRFFAMMTWCMSVWSVSLYLFYQPNPTALFWGRLVFAISYFTGYALLGFAIDFPSSAGISSSVYKLLARFRQIYLVFVVALSLISISTGLILSRIEFFSWGTNFIPGPIYFTFIVHMVLCTITSFILLGIKFKRSADIGKLQIKYLFMGLFVSGVITLFTNLIWPLISGSNQLSKFGPYSMIFIIGFTTYAITRYRLMDIRLAIKKSLAHTIAIAVVLIVYTSIVLILQRVLIEQYNWNLAITIILSVLIISLSVEPLRRFVVKSVNDIFYTKKEKRQEELLKSKVTLTSITELGKSIDYVVTSYLSELGSEKIMFLVRSKKGLVYESIYPKASGLSIQSQDPLFQYIRLNPDIIVREEIPYLLENSHLDKKLLEKVEHSLDKLGISVVMPMTLENQVFGLFLLGPKKSREPFTKEDIDILKHLQITSSSCLINAIMYKEAVERIVV